MRLTGHGFNKLSAVGGGKSRAMFTLSFERHTTKPEVTSSLQDPRENHTAFCCKSAGKFMSLHIAWGTYVRSQMEKTKMKTELSVN